MDSEVAKLSPELSKRGYSEDEVTQIYALGRRSLENGQVHQGEVIMQGLTRVVPDFAPAWLALAYVHIVNKHWDEALFCSRQALRIDPDFTAATLYLIACLLTTGDYNTAGTYLGEIGENIDNGIVTEPNLVRFYRAQLYRFKSR